jgi:class 3 adenylate cyclase
MLRTPAASGEGPVSRAVTPQLLPVLRGTLVAVMFALSVVALWVASVQLVSGWRPGRAWPAAPVTVDAIVALLVLFGALVGGMALLSGLHLWEARIGRARAERYRARSREWQEAQREQAETTARFEVERPAVEAILVVDLVQSTELIAEHGDEFFRDLLRRIETAFLPVARRWRTRGVDGHGDGFLFCFGNALDALGALREMYQQVPAIHQGLADPVEVSFRASLHVGPTIADSRGNRAGLSVLKTVRLGSVMETLFGRGGGRNSLVVSEEAHAALQAAGVPLKSLGPVPLRGFPGTHPVYQVEL